MLKFELIFDNFTFDLLHINKNSMDDIDSSYDIYPSDSEDDDNLNYEKYSSSSSSKSNESDEETLETKMKYYRKRGLGNMIDKLQKFKKEIQEEQCKFFQNTRCKIIYPCCSKSFCCHLCHEEYHLGHKSCHTFNKANIRYIECMRCNKRQRTSNQCTLCDIKFAKYYCDKCKIYSNTSEEMFHCNKCNACITGNNKQYKHCDKCKCCIDIYAFNKHKCLANRLDDYCPICLEILRSEPASIMSCGHAIHRKCFEDLKQASYKCPQCSKTIMDMSIEFKKLDDEIKNDVYTQILNVKIYCNDCEKTNTIQYHHAGLKCSDCGSYNTYKK